MSTEVKLKYMKSGDILVDSYLIDSPLHVVVKQCDLIILMAGSSSWSAEIWKATICFAIINNFTTSLPLLWWKQIF